MSTFLARHPFPLMDTYRAYYSEATNDPYNGSYRGILNEYISNANSPQDLRNKVYNSGNAGRALSHLLLVRDPNQPGHGPGKILAYHRATRYDARIGQTTPFDGMAYSFIGDVHGSQPPMTVILPDDLFNSAGTVQVPTAARIDQILAADNNLELVGPFAATDPDVEPVTVRWIVYIPPKYLLMALDTTLTPRQAWNQIRGAIVADGKEADCSLLIDWLRASITRRAANDQPRTTVVPPTPQTLIDPQHAREFMAYRLQILHQDLPQLSPSAIGAGAQAIAANIADLATETRITREEADERRIQETNKTPKDFYGPTLTRLMRLAQVSNEAGLQTIHTSLAKAKKSLQRKALQAAIDVALEQLDYQQECQVSASMAKKILDLEYASNLENDFTVGLNVFNMGPLEPESVESQRLLIAQTDAMMSNEASPSLSDVITILDPTGDVSIPRTIAELRYNVEKFHAIMVVLFGTNHALVMEIKTFHDALISRERKLERAVPKDPRLRYIVPALIGRRFQLETNYWMTEQARSSTNIAVPNLRDVFQDIALKKDWAPDFPDRYITSPAPPLLGPAPTPIRETPDDASALTTPTGLGSQSGSGGSNPSNRTNVQVENDNYNTIFDSFRNLGVRIAKIRERCRANNVQFPKNNRGTTMCLAYHIKGGCNERCGSKEQMDLIFDFSVTAGGISGTFVFIDDHSKFCSTGCSFHQYLSQLE